MWLYRYMGIGEVVYEGGEIRPAYIHLASLHVIEETEKTWVVEYDKRRRILKSPGGKKYAYPTKEEAMKSFKIRNKRYIQHLERQLRNAQTIKMLIEAGTYDG